MDMVTSGTFAFVYREAPQNTAPIKARAEFFYHEGKWYLNTFWYGGPSDFHSVEVIDGPDRKR